MTRKFLRLPILTLILIAAFIVPINVLAGGVCGGTYIVESGETFNSIAARCGTSAAAIIAANPGVSEPLKTGQALTVPGVNYNVVIIDGSASSQNQANYGPVN